MKLLLRRVLLFATIGSMLIDAVLGQGLPSPTTTPTSTASTLSTSSLVGNGSTPAAVVGRLWIVQGPQNQTVESQSSVLLDVNLSAPYSGRVVWRMARLGSTIGVRILDSQASPQNAPDFPSSNYQLANQYALNIMAAKWKDGGTYTVVLSDAGGIYASATLVVIEKITPSISPALTANATTSNTTVNLTCTVEYGGPSPTVMVTQDQTDRTPKLSMVLGTMDLTNASTEQFVAGAPGITKSVLTRTIVYKLTPYEVMNKVKLACTVTTANPVYSQTEFLTIQAEPEIPDDPSKRFIIDPQKDEYNIDDIITCSVRLAYPEAIAVWRPVNSPGYQWVDVAGEDQLVVDKDMPPGEHTWACVAIDGLNHTIEEFQFTFNVSGHHAGWWNDEEAEKQKRIGLGVGLGLGLFFLLLLIILVVYCLVVRKRQEKRRPPTVSKQPPSATDGYRPLDNNPGAEYTPSQVPPPIYQPKAAAVPLTGRGAGSPVPSDLNAVPLLERSGHGDLGGSAQYRPQSPAVRSTSSVASSARPNGTAPDAGSNAGFADLGPVAGPPSANRSMLSHNTSVISSGASSIVDPAMQQSSRPLSNRTYMAGGPRDSGRDQLISPSSGQATGV